MQTSVKHTLHRRQFLGTLAATTAVGLAGLAPFHLQAAQQQQGSTEGATSAFENWLGKIHGKHRQVFDSPHHVNGLPFAWARVFLMTNESSGVPKDEVQAVMVLRHAAIPLAMESGLWKKYNFAKVFEVKNEETKAPLTQNVFWQPKQGMLPLPGMGINELLDSGVLIGVCDMALKPVVSGALAWVLLGQRVTWLTVAGGAMVLAAGATLVVAEGRRNPDDFEPEPTLPST